MATDAKARHAKLAGADVGIACQMVENRARVHVEIGHRSTRRVVHPAAATRVVERNDHALRLATMVNLGRRYHESIPRQAHARTQHGVGELEYVRIEQYPRPFSRYGRPRDEGAHRAPAGRDIHIV